MAGGARAVGMCKLRLQLVRPKLKSGALRVKPTCRGAQHELADAHTSRCACRVSSRTLLRAMEATTPVNRRRELAVDASAA